MSAYVVLLGLLWLHNHEQPFCLSIKLVLYYHATLNDWLKNLAPRFHPIRSKTVIYSRTFSRPLHQLHAFALSFDWFIGLSVSFAIG